MLRGQTEPMTAVDVYDNGQLLGPATIVIEGSGGWFYEIADLAPGTHVFTAITKDDAGNVVAAVRAGDGVHAPERPDRDDRGPDAHERRRRRPSR